MGNDGNSIENAQTSPATPPWAAHRGAAATRAVDGGEAASDIRPTGSEVDLRKNDALDLHREILG
jgi:hypothetical protein